MGGHGAGEQLILSCCLISSLSFRSVLRETGLDEALLIKLPDDLDKAWAVWLVLPVPSPAPGKGSSCAT